MRGVREEHARLTVPCQYLFRQPVNNRDGGMPRKAFLIAKPFVSASR